MKTLIDIQARLRAPKNQFNRFGGYKYRSCEDILTALKPLLAQHQAVLTISDSIEVVGTRTYVRAVATLLTSDGNTFSATAYAREEETKKGMDASQITGTASSYARKYALNGLFAIDDTPDADFLPPAQQAETGNTGEPDDNLSLALQEINTATSRDVLVGIYNNYPMLHTDTKFTAALTKRKKQLQ